MDKNIFGDTKILVFIFGLVVIVLKKTMAGFPTLFITPLKLTISSWNGPFLLSLYLKIVISVPLLLLCSSTFGTG